MMPEIASNVFDQISAQCFGGISYADIGEKAELPPRADKAETQEPGLKSEPGVINRSGLEIHLFYGGLSDATS